MPDLTGRPVPAGQLLVLIAAATMAATVWLFPVAVSAQVQACAVAGGMVIAALLCGWILRSGAPRGRLAVFPMIVFVGVAGVGEINSVLGGSYGGFFILAFIYVGMRLPAGSTRRLIAPAAGLWLLGNGALTGAQMAPIEVRLPIAICLWLCVGEVLSAQVRTTDRAAAVLQRQADLDPLTDLLNRRALEGVFARARGGDAVVLIDLDHFKAVNDRHGHSSGDQVLVEFAGVLSASVRDNDLVVRYGGEEFMLFLPDTTAHQVDLVLKRIRERWAAQQPLTTFSAGIGQVGPAHDAALALANADRCLYRAKDAGRDQWLHSEHADSIRTS